MLCRVCQEIVAQVWNLCQCGQYRFRVSSLSICKPNLFGNEFRRWLPALKFSGKLPRVRTREFSVFEQNHVYLEPESDYANGKTSPAAPAANPSSATESMVDEA